MTSFTSASLIPLLEAASVSPTAAHCSPSIASLFHAVTQCHKVGAKTAKPEDLSALVAVVHAESPGISMWEDFRPYDARAEVLVRWGPELLRLLPGSLERPTPVVDQHLLLASVIDPVIVPQVGFGLFDAGELILRRLDHVARSLAPRWSEGPAAEVGATPHVTQAEVDSAAELVSISEMLTKCVDPGRAAAAAARYTSSAKKLRCIQSSPVSTFDTAIATRIRGTVVPLPAGFLIEALLAIGADLAGVASRADPRTNDVFAKAVAKRIGRVFQGSGHSIGGPVRVGSDDPIHSLIVFNGRQILALDVAAGLTPDVIQARLDEGGRRLARVRPGVEVRTPGGVWRLPSDAEVTRVQVIAGPHHAVLLTPSAPMMGIEDLEWIVYSSQKSRDDLWYFVRDLESKREIETDFAWDLIDRWEVWRQQKSFYRGGARLTSMFFAPHAAVAEWEDAANAAPTERALHVLGLPPLRAWPIAALDGGRGAEVGDLDTDQVFHVTSWPVPVAVAKTDSSGPSEHSSTLWSLAVGVAWKLEHSFEAFTDAASRSGLKSLRIVFEFRQRDSGPPLTVEDFADRVLTIGWDSRLQVALAKDSLAVERLCGELVSHALAPSAREGFVTAWNAAPPGVRIDGFTVRQSAQRLPEPLEPHDAIRSDVLRQLGEYLAASEIEPTVFDGVEATRFESSTVFPWLVAKFHQTIAGLAGRTLLEFALFQLECLHHHRFMLDKRLGWERGFPTRGQSNSAERREAIARATRVVSFIVEEVLAHPPAGDTSVDDVAWVNALSVADLCIESCFRSASLHHQLTRTCVEVTDLFEVKVAESDEPTDVAMRTYEDLRKQSTLPAAVPIATGQHEEPEDDGDGPCAVVDLMPQLATIDDAMRSSLGFGIDAVTGLLNVATSWEAHPSAPAVLTSQDAVVDRCVELAVGATREEYASALDWLTLRGADLAGNTIPHWETERRAKRVTTSPFVAAYEGLWILPWTAESTLRIVANYLYDGRLPWPNNALPRPVIEALDRYRQRQNREMEKECVAALNARGLVVRGSVQPKKAKHYGISNLTGEIDALCIDTQRSRIWVIEAKDPYTPYSSHQIRRLINDFNAPGKYVDRLLRKVSDITACANSVARALKVPNPSRPWVVTGLMVTRHLEPAALTINPKVTFCILDDIVEVVDQDALPEPGLHGWYVSA